DLNGPVDSGTSNLIGTCSGCGLSNGTGGNQVGVTNALLAPLGNYGGPTQTHALLPGSPAINKGTSSGAPGAEQRGVSRRVQPTFDTGAFESQGSTLSRSSGDNQGAPTNTAFPAPLVVQVTGSPGEPVNGGIVTFTPPMSGASASLSPNPVTISG